MSSTYPHGWSNGVVIRGIPLQMTNPGKVFWLNGSTVLAEKGIGGSNSNDGTYQRPFATLDYAVGRCTADRGDIIMIMPGHTENLSTVDAVDIDVAGVSVIGLGSGANRPTFTYTVAAGEITIGADDVTIDNIIMNAGITDVLKGINVETGKNGFTIRNCLFGVDTTGTHEFTAAIYVQDGSTSSLIEGNVITMGLGGAIQAIHLDADTANLIIRDNYITGDYSTAVINGDTTLSTDILIDNNILINGIGGNINTNACIILFTATTGILRRNTLVCDVATPADAISSDTTFMFENWYSETINAAAFELPTPTSIPYTQVKVATKSGLIDDVTANIFTVASGDVIVYALWATVKTDADSAVTAAVNFNATAGASSDFFIGTVSGALTAANTGDGLSMTGGVVTLDSPVAPTGIMDPVIVKAGFIEYVKGGTAGALVLDWHCTYAPLTAGATLAAS